jgi:hypothetical protein
MQKSGKVENVWSSHHINTNPSEKDLERNLRDDFKGCARGNTANAVVTVLWERISMMTIEWTKTIPETNLAPHRSTVMIASEANTIAIALPPRR